MSKIATKKLLLIIVSALVVIAIPILFFSEHRQQQIEDWATGDWLAQHRIWAAAAIFALFSADILLPIPSSAVCIVAAELFGFPLGTLLCWFGLNVSSGIGFYLGHTLGYGAVQRFSDPQSVASVKQEIDRWGIWPLIAFRPLPVLAEASILMLGTYRYSRRKFWPAILLGNFLFAALFVGMGKWFADNNQTGLGLIIGCVIPALLLLIWSSVRRKTDEKD